jgi:SnoaL-like domain
MLETTQPSVKAALQRARASLDASVPSRDRAPEPRSAAERAVAEQFVVALESGDVDSTIALLTEDAWLTMPPEPHEYQGRDAIAAFIRHRAPLLGGRLRLVPTRANGQPAFGCYVPDTHADIAHSYGIMVLTLAGGRVSAITWFTDRSLFPLFGLPRTLPPSLTR